MNLSLQKKSLILARYIDNLKQQGKASRTQETYIKCIKKFLHWIEQEHITDLTQIDRDIISRYQQALFNQDTPHLSLRRQHCYLCAVKSLFNFLTKQNHLIFNPTSHLELPRIPQTLPRQILTEKQINKLLAAPDLDTDLGIRDRAILELLYSTGIRNTELRTLKVYDVELENSQVKIINGKGNKSRIVPLGKLAHIYLKEYISQARPKLINKQKKLDTGILFLSTTGKQLDISIIPHIIQRYIKQAGIKHKIGAHTIRHTMATHLLRHKAPLRCIQEILGHSSLDTTQQYLKVEISDLKRIHAKTHPRERI